MEQDDEGVRPTECVIQAMINSCEDMYTIRYTYIQNQNPIY